MPKAKSKVKKFKLNSSILQFKQIRPDLGTLVFGFVFIYILICIVIYFARDHVAVYQVKTGEIVENETYTGIALRTEQLYYADASGELTCTGAEGTRVSPQSPIYIVGDASGTGVVLTSEEPQTEGETDSQEDGAETTGFEFSDNDYGKFYDEIDGFISMFQPDQFAAVYHFKNSLNNSIFNAFYNNEHNGEMMTVNPNSRMATTSGVLIYGYDSYENVTADTFAPKMLSKSEYKYHSVLEQTQISSGDVAYKLITDEKWEIIIKLDEASVDKYIDHDYVEVRFFKDRNIVWAQIEKFERDGATYCRLKFTNSMVRYATERFIDIEVLLNSETGLKIPNSAICTKQFYSIPKEYLTYDEEENFYTIKYLKVSRDGAAKQVTEEIEPYYIDSEYAYIDRKDIDNKTQLLHPTGGEMMTVGEIGTLSGVYQLNKGYAVFNVVTIVYKNDDYSIIKPNEVYGLTQYDRIALDGNSVEDDQVIY